MTLLEPLSFRRFATARCRAQTSGRRGTNRSLPVVQVVTSVTDESFTPGQQTGMVYPMTNEPASRHCLLLIEDDSMVRETIILMLEDDYEVLAESSAGASLAHLQAPDAQPIDVILLDCLLPDGKAADVLTVADQRSIPVVLISGDLRQAQMLDPRRLFLPKPFTQTTLLQTLDSARD